MNQMTADTAAISVPVEVEGTEARLAMLFNTHHQRLYRLARRLSPSADDAKDLVQETFLRAVQKLATIPEGRIREESWLVRVLINVCKDRWRRSEVRRRLHDGNVQHAPSDESAVIAKTTIWTALERLSPRRRAILIMCELDGLTISTVARTLGVRAVTVRWHLSRGRRDLAAIIGSGGTR